MRGTGAVCVMRAHTLALFLFFGVVQASFQTSGAQPPPQQSPALTAGAAEAAPGIPLPPRGMVWALDSVDGRQTLAHLAFHPTVVNVHAARNLLMPPLVPTRGSVELGGPHATTRLVSGQTRILVRSRADRQDELEISADPTRMVLVHLRTVGQKRTMTRMSFNYIGTLRSRSQDAIDAEQTSLARGEWTELTPRQPLVPGEYAIVFLPTRLRKSWFPRTVVDFGVGEPAK